MNGQVREIERIADNAVIIHVDLPSEPSKWQGWLHLTSDVHFDNVKCRRDVLKRHLEIADKREALWFDNGDWHCAMQGKYDKRSNLSDLREEYKAADYLTRLRKYAADFIEPHADRLGIMGKGNHETSQLDHHGEDLTGGTVDILKDRVPNCRAVASAYTTYVTFRFYYRTQQMTVRLWMIHGYGGGGPVTKDLIQLNRQLAYMDNADIMLSGHTHDSWMVAFTRMGFAKDGKPQRRIGYAIKCPTMKDDYNDGKGGWSIERGHPPKPLGSYFVRFTYSAKDKRMHFKPIVLDEHDTPESYA